MEFCAKLHEYFSKLVQYFYLSIYYDVLLNNKFLKPGETCGKSNLFVGIKTLEMLAE